MPDIFPFSNFSKITVVKVRDARSSMLGANFAIVSMLILGD